MIEDRSEFWMVIIYIVVTIFIIWIGLTIRHNGYEDGYAAAKMRYECSLDKCDGYCNHVQESIEKFIDDEEIIRRDNLFEEEGVYSSDDMDESYWEGAYDGYIEGYGDRYYGNKRELDLDEYENKNLFDW